MKTCTKCGETKELTEFYKNKKAVDGLNWHCKVCRYKVKQTYILKGDNSAKKSAAYKVWYQANREELLQKKREKRKLPAEKVKNRHHYLNRRARLGEEMWKAIRVEARIRGRPVTNKYDRGVCERLTDAYIRTVINSAGGINIPTHMITKELIEVKRLQILINRRIKNENSNATT